MIEQRFIQPLDILFLRDNHLFGSSGGDSSQTLMPPWPSVFAGAIRSRMLADAGVSIQALKNGQLPAPLDTILGTPGALGSFTITDVSLARRQADDSLEILRPLPADLVVTEAETPDQHNIRQLQPKALPAGLASSAGSTQLPVLKTNTQAKPVNRHWLNEAGWQAWLTGQSLDGEKHLIPVDTLWQTETRLGIALDETQGSAAESQIYTSDAIALCENTGFVVTIAGGEGQLPTSGLLRLGGDGRGATIRDSSAHVPEPDWAQIEQTGRFRMVLTSPGLFPGGGPGNNEIPGDLPPGMNSEGRWHFHGARARLTSRIVPRHQVVSGWDMARHAPKPALRCAPAGAVYWFDGFEGSRDALQKLFEHGLWDLSEDNDNPARRAEGYNRITIANA